MSTKLKPQFFPERLAALEAFEELFEDADDNRVDADPFRLCPLSQRGSGFCAEMEELRPGKRHACLAGLLNLHLFPINLAQGEENNPRQIAFHARLLRDCFSQIDRKPERRRHIGLSLAGLSPAVSCAFLIAVRFFFFTATNGPPAFIRVSLSLQKDNAFCPPPSLKVLRMLLTRATSSIMTRRNCHARRSNQVSFHHFTRWPICLPRAIMAY